MYEDVFISLSIVNGQTECFSSVSTWSCMLGKSPVQCIVYLHVQAFSGDISVCLCVHATASVRTGVIQPNVI